MTCNAQLPSDGVFSHRKAARLYGMDIGEPALIEITVPARCAAWPRPGQHVRHARLDEGDVTELHGRPVTSPIRTVFDLARHLPRVEAVAAVDMCLNRGLADLATFQRYASQRAGWSGVVQARRVVELAEPESESWMESVLRMILIGGRLPRPRVQARLTDVTGRFIARADLFYDKERVVIEYDGSNHRERLVEDNRRQNRLQRAGYVMLRYTAPDVYDNPDGIVSEVRAQLRRARAPRVRDFMKTSVV